MEFYEYPEGAAGNLFRPAYAKYGMNTRNESQLKVNAEVAKQAMIDAYGPPIEYKSWQKVVEVDGFVEKVIPGNSWYWTQSDFSTELYLTNEIQLSIIILTVPDVKVIKCAGGYNDEN